MWNLYNKGVLNYKTMKTLVVDTFDKFNGVINPVNVAERLVFVHNKSYEGGRSYGKTIAFNMGVYSKYNFKKMQKEMKFSDDTMNVNLVTEVMMTVLHELSHLDQDMAKYGSQEELEVGNDVHTNDFVINNQDMIEETMNTKIDNRLYLVLCQYTKYRCDPVYHAINESTLLDSLIYKVTGHTLTELLDWAYENGVDVQNWKFADPITEIDEKTIKTGDSARVRVSSSDGILYIGV